jgi:L-alanine-DL-glutamate epimerase-like enolase superfamily enzyme
LLPGPFVAIGGSLGGALALQRLQLFPRRHIVALFLAWSGGLAVRRNHQMAQAGDMLVAFHVNNSLGTAHMIACMRALGKPVVVIRVEATA